jgi:ATP-dependent Clp protease ATP-binding subunit ClpC
MQIDAHAPARGRGPSILQIAGFGAFRTLEAEAGLHVLDSEGGQRIVARVKIAAGPWQEPRGDAYPGLAACLARAADSTTVVRRYRESPAPLVRDAKAGWRSGRLQAVLDGDFDLIGALR